LNSKGWGKKLGGYKVMKLQEEDGDGGVFCRGREERKVHGLIAGFRMFLPGERGLLGGTDVRANMCWGEAEGGLTGRFSRGVLCRRRSHKAA